MLSRAAARVRCPASATARKSRKCRSSICMTYHISRLHIFDIRTGVVPFSYVQASEDTAMKCLLLAFASMICSSAVLAEPTAILFVGNSYTFGRVDPVESYNAGKVDDMTRPRPDLPGAPFTDTSGTNPWEPHPWGGVPGIF